MFCHNLFLVYLLILILQIKSITSADDTAEFVKKYGYDLEVHKAFTEDGWILKMHRLFSPKESSQNYKYGIKKIKTPVLAIHGYFGSSFNFVAFPDHLGYRLVRAGFDVFLGNLRGNLYSKHSKYKITDDRFWDFGLDEQAKYDIPAMIDKVLEVTNSKELHLITYSMSFTEYLISLSYKPEYSKKIKHLVALAPTTTAQGYSRRAQLLELFRVEELGRNLNFNQVMPLNFYEALSSSICKYPTSDNNFCALILMSLTGDDVNQVDNDLWPRQFNGLQLTSRKQILHYYQMAISNRFCKLSYGPENNLKIYGSIQPPNYNVTAKISNVSIFLGTTDVTQSIGEMYEIIALLKKLARSLTVYKASYYKFGHLSFIFAKNAGKLVYKDLVKALLNSESSG